MTARTATVQNTLEHPGTLSPIAGATVSIRLNTAGFTTDGLREKVKTRTATTDTSGLWSVVLEINDDIDPAGSSYTVREASGTIWTIQLTAVHSGLTVQLRDVLVVDPTNPNPLTAGATLAALAAGDAATLATAETYADGKITKPTVTPTAGQIYGADSAGNTVVKDRTIAYAEYADGAAYPLTASTPFYFPGTAVSIPASPDDDVAIEYTGGFSITTAGAGQVSCILYETTSGTPVALDASPLYGGFLAGLFSSSVQPPTKRYNLGPTSAERQFVLGGLMSRDAASVLAASIKTGSVIRNPWYLKVVA